MKEQGVRADDPEYLKIAGVLQAVKKQNDFKFKQHARQIQQYQQHQQQELQQQREQQQLQQQQQQHQQQQQQQQPQQQNGNVPQQVTNGINGMSAHTFKYGLILMDCVQDKVSMPPTRVHRLAKPPLLLRLVYPTTNIPLPP